jgi:hypothetical protein
MLSLSHKQQDFSQFCKGLILVKSKKNNNTANICKSPAAVAGGVLVQACKNLRS